MKILHILLVVFITIPATFSQDYFRLRNDPSCILISDESVMTVDSKRIHSDLAASVDAARISFDEEKKEVKGSIAAGRFQCIFSDATVITANFLSNDGNVYFLPSGESVDTDLQIATDLTSTGKFIKTITGIDKKLNFGIFHIFLEKDPSVDSRKKWSEILSELNETGLGGLISKHAKEVTNPDELKKVVTKRQGTTKPRFLTIFSSRSAYGDARYKCFDGFHSQVPSVLDIRSRKTPLNVHPFSILPPPYCIFSHFLDSQDPVTVLTTIPIMGKNLLTICEESLVKQVKVPLHGFSNIGNTCYFNALTQALFASSGFRRVVDGMLFNKDLPFNLASVFSSFFETLQSTSVEKQAVIETKDFFDEVQKLLDLKSKLCDEELKYFKGADFVKSRHFSEEIADHNLEHDSSELLTYILELIRIESEHRGTDVASNFDKQFQIVERTSTECSKCKRSSGSQNSSNILEVDLSSDSLDACLADMLKTETLSLENRWNCGTPGCKGTTARKFSFVTLPQVLFVQLKRFLTPEIKVQKQITYAEKMNIGKKSYQLKSVISHHGDSLNAGHYTASVLGPDGRWYSANDKEILGPMAFGVENDAYMLVYGSSEK